MIKEYKLDPEEEKILSSFEKDEWIPVKNQKEELAKLKASAKAYGNKAHRVNIRLTTWDYEKAQAKALEEGIPFTTLIGAIVHQFLSGQLIARRNS